MTAATRKRYLSVDRGPRRVTATAAGAAAVRAARNRGAVHHVSPGATVVVTDHGERRVLSFLRRVLSPRAGPPGPARGGRRVRAAVDLRSLPPLARRTRQQPLRLVGAQHAQRGPL